MANVTLYSDEELKAMGWDFATTTRQSYLEPEDSFMEDMGSARVPEDFPDIVSFADFKPYFSGTEFVPNLIYGGFTSSTIFFAMERYTSPVSNWAMAVKVQNTGINISGLTIKDVTQGVFAILCYAENDAEINYTISYNVNGGSYIQIHEGWAQKQVDGVIPIVYVPVLFGETKAGDKISFLIKRLTNTNAGKFYISAIGLGGTDVISSYTQSTKFFIDPKTGEKRMYSNVSPLCVLTSDSIRAATSFASAIEYGEQVLVASEPDKIYFEKEELYQWISPQQLEQFEKMYPACFEVSYNSALGYLYSQIGELYDIPAILAKDTNEGTAKIMRWILTVLTAYNITSPSARHSESLRDNFDMVVKKITEMKNGATTLNNAPIKDEPSAWGTVVNSGKHKMLG